MSLKEKIGWWIIRRRLMAALKKGLKMKPLPKWIGWVAIICATFGTGGAFAGLIPVKIALMLATAGTLVNGVTHSVNGMGGTEAPK
jgi:hypothetical protein